MKYGLDQYYPKFEDNDYTEPRQLAELKNMNESDIRTNLEVEKKAHRQKLMAAIKKLQYTSLGNFVCPAFFFGSV